MKIAVDLDGVVYEWQRTFRYMMNEYRGTNLGPIEEWWDGFDAFKNHVSSEDMLWLWSEGIKLGLFRYGHVTTGAIVGLRALVEDGHRLVVATHRPVLAVPDTLAWLSYINIPWSGVHILSDGEKKTSISADVLVDDKLENAIEWAMTGREALLYDRPWNQGAKHDPEPYWRVSSWESVVGVVNTLEHQRGL
jgi:uncharacterized HAD superfamily protein